MKIIPIHKKILDIEMLLSLYDFIPSFQKPCLDGSNETNKQYDRKTYNGGLP